MLFIAALLSAIIFNPSPATHATSQRSSVQTNEPRWVTTGALKTARFDHTATLLPNGKVLVAAGFGQGKMLNSAELYDPATGAWSVTGSLHDARQDHDAILLLNGKVLVVGGLGSTDNTTFGGIGGIGGGGKTKELSSAELYDPATGKWSETGSLKIGRIHHTAVLLTDGKVLVVGGHGNGDSLTSAELYDPATGQWNSAANLKIDRMDPTATLLPNGKVLVAGGTSRMAPSSAELYDPATNSWRATGSLKIPRWFHTATLLPNGLVLVESGAGYPSSQSQSNRTSAELYDPATGAWSSTGHLQTDRMSHTTTLLANGKVLVAGGKAFGKEGGITPGVGQLTSAELYDPVKGTWSATANLNTAREMHSATLLHNGKVLVAGGISNSAALTSAELYDPQE